MPGNHKKIIKSLKKHYENTFKSNGPSSAGVDWGYDESKLNLRYEKMLAVLQNKDPSDNPSLLDVGCGYGGLIQYGRKKGFKLQYTGIDVASNMISWARKI